MNHQERLTCSSPNWVKKVKQQVLKLEETRSTELERWKHEAIYKIPPSLKKLSRSAYEPQTVSIGPYHHGARRLKDMEEHKQRALHNFLERHAEKPLERYVDALGQVFEELQRAYRKLDDKWKKDKEAFLQLMMVDGCFILEVLMLTAKKDARRCRYVENDPVFSCGGRLYLAPYLQRDMLMLENQLPMQVLTTILDVAGALNSDALSKQDQLNDLILQFLSPPPKERVGMCSRILRSFCGKRQHEHSKEEQHEAGKKEQRIHFGECLHILDLYRKKLLSLGRGPKQGRCPKQSMISCISCGDDEEADVYTYSATELKEAGIQFDKSKTRSLNDVTFRRGVLKLPRIMVDDATESTYRNLMAFERLHADTGSDVTSFVFFMDKMIDSAKDVSLLNRQGIIRNALGSDDEAAKLFNTLSREACPDSSHKISGVHKDLVRYCRSPLPKWIAYAKHNYFTNPLVALSVVAAVLLFALTAIQTVYTVIAYYHPKNG